MSKTLLENGGREVSGKWAGGKGDQRRPAAISKKEQDLRWRLMLEKDEAKRAEIKRELEGLSK